MAFSIPSRCKVFDMAIFVFPSVAPFIFYITVHFFMDDFSNCLSEQVPVVC